MGEEWKKIKNWPCGVCHMLDPTSFTGKTRKPKTRQGQIDADARVAEKQAFVDAIKVAIGACQYPGCNRPVTLETARGCVRRGPARSRSVRAPIIGCYLRVSRDAGLGLGHESREKIVPVVQTPIRVADRRAGAEDCLLYSHSLAGRGAGP